MSEDIKRIDIAEFRDEGYLQEANRLFFHPLGLALEVIIDEETGETELGGIWDFRDDPEGILYRPETLGTAEAYDKAGRIALERATKGAVRWKRYGYVVQPIPEGRNESGR
jgi:hypothetical protein